MKSREPLSYLSDRSETAISKALVAFCLALAPLWPAFSEVTFETLLSNAQNKSGQVGEAQADVEAARSQLSLARAAVFPHVGGMLLAAPLFGLRDPADYNTPDLSRWGPYIRAGVQIVQPIYSFGMLSSYRDAAEKQIVAKEELTKVKKAEVVMMAKEFYYGLQMATELETLVGDLVKFLDEAATKAEESSKKKSKGDVAVKPHDLFKLKTSLDDLKQRLLLATQSKKTAERAVAWITNTQIDALPVKALKPEAFEKKTLEEYLAMAKANRPEFKALAAGKEARASLRDAKRAQSFPILFAGGFASYGWTPMRTPQPNPYAYDPYNRLEGGAGVGLKLDLEFARHSAEAAEQEAELNKLRATETYAVPGIELQVKKAFWELEQALDGLTIAEKRKATAKKWFYQSGMGWSIGITAPKDLMESLEGHGLARKNYIETVYAVNMALAHLSQAVGKEVTQLSYQ